MGEISRTERDREKKNLSNNLNTLFTAEPSVHGTHLSLCRSSMLSTGDLGTLQTKSLQLNYTHAIEPSLPAHAAYSGYFVCYSFFSMIPALSGLAGVPGQSNSRSSGRIRPSEISNQGEGGRNAEGGSLKRADVQTWDWTVWEKPTASLPVMG